MKASAAAGGGLLLGFYLPQAIGAEAAEAATVGAFAPNAFVRIDRDDRVTLIMPQVEMGQGTYTSMPMLIAEKLEVSLAQVTLEAAPPDDRLYTNPLIGFQATGGSTSVRATWKPLRRAGAVARTMLIAAAARRWNVRSAVLPRREGRGDPRADQPGKLRYGFLGHAAAALPVPDNVALKYNKEFKLIGTPAKRLDTPDKVNGKALFGIDAKLPGMKIATVAACPVFGGKLASVIDGEAMAINGVRQVVRLDDAVAVIADRHARGRRSKASPLSTSSGTRARTPTSRAPTSCATETASRNPGIVGRRNGDVAKAMAGAARRVEAVYQVPFLAHAAMEPMNCAVHVQREVCEVWVGSQVVGRAQAAAAAVTGLPLERVQVHNHLLGGGFGRRLEVDYVTQAVRIAKQVDGPVKVVWTREEDIQHDIYRPYYYDRLSAGLDEQGLPIAWIHRVTGSSIEARWLPSPLKDGLDTDAVEGAAEELQFAIPNILVDYVRHEPPGVTTGWWRGVGPTHNIFMVESFIDELAAEAERTPSNTVAPC